MGTRGEVHQVHGGGRPGLRRNASQAAAYAALARLVLLALDTGYGAGLAGMGDTAGVGGHGGTAALLGGVIFMVDLMTLLQVGPGKGLATDLAGEAPAEGMCLHMSLEVLGAGVSAAAVAAGVQRGTGMASIWSRGRGRVRKIGRRRTGRRTGDCGDGCGGRREQSWSQGVGSSGGCDARHGEMGRMERIRLRRKHRRPCRRPRRVEYVG